MISLTMSPIVSLLTFWDCCWPCCCWTVVIAWGRLLEIWLTIWLIKSGSWPALISASKVALTLTLPLSGKCSKRALAILIISGKACLIATKITGMRRSSANLLEISPSETSLLPTKLKPTVPSALAATTSFLVSKSYWATAACDNKARKAKEAIL